MKVRGKEWWERVVLTVYTNHEQKQNFCMPHVRSGQSIIVAHLSSLSPLSTLSFHLLGKIHHFTKPFVYLFSETDSHNKLDADDGSESALKSNLSVREHCKAV
ncbi:hypothetical protein AMECASPLE_037991 [Ameca splendens]|uniref:Uncharacterized protein n=1 Tax=Ameca splendens TaxID=208324 RepID=A0ABV0XL36_9TELE